MKKLITTKTFQMVRFQYDLYKPAGSASWEAKRFFRTITYFAGIPIWFKNSEVQQVILDGFAGMKVCS